MLKFLRCERPPKRPRISNTPTTAGKWISISNLGLLSGLIEQPRVADQTNTETEVMLAPAETGWLTFEKENFAIYRADGKWRNILIKAGKSITFAPYSNTALGQWKAQDTETALLDGAEKGRIMKQIRLERRTSNMNTEGITFVVYVTVELARTERARIMEEDEFIAEIRKCSSSGEH